jgi:hypothetical protein
MGQEAPAAFGVGGNVAGGKAHGMKYLRVGI